MGERFADGLVGIVLDGKYRLDAVLGEGGMGSVFRATHVAMEKRVAIKLLKPHLTSDDTQLERFAREARSTMKVESPHAVRVMDFGITPQRDYYMVLEYLDGRSVQRELEEDGPFAPRRAVHVIRQTLQAIGAAHAMGLVHRDLKPDNILLIRQGDDPDYAKLLDFGVAKLMEGTAKSSRSQLALTMAGMVFGTPEFMSPEQACGQPLDGRSDLYSIACTLFVMLTGTALFQALSPIEFLTCHVRTPPPNLGAVRPELAQYGALNAVLQKCLSKKREQRPATAAELDAMLEAIEPELVGGVAAVSLPPVMGLAPTEETKPVSAQFSESAYLQAVEPTKELTGSYAALDGDSDSDGFAPAKPRFGKGSIAVIGGALVVAIAIVTVAAVTRAKRTTTVAVATTKVDARVIDAATAAPVDAESTSSRDAGSGMGMGTGMGTNQNPNTKNQTGSANQLGSAKPPPPQNPHLVAAEAARSAKNRLRQLAESDLALRDDPKSTRAKFLLGDALVATGDLERGCKYLRALGNYGPARAAAAPCP